MFRLWCSLFAVVMLLIPVPGCPGGGGGFVNDNNSADEPCNTGESSLAAPLTGAGVERGDMFYREFADGCREFIVRVEGFAEGAHDVVVDDSSVGAVAVGPDGTGELVYDTGNGTFPAGFPDITAGTAGNVDGVISGTFEEDCPAVAEVCSGGNVGDGNTGGSGGNVNPGTQKLTVTLLCRTPGCVNMLVYVCVDGQAYTRTTAPYNDAALCTRFLQSDAVTSKDFTATRGQTATVIAIELTGSGTAGGGTSVDPASLKSPSAVYFVDWQGDTGNKPEEGVIQVSMDDNRTVVALFDIMPLIRWGKTNEDRPELGGGCWDFSLVAAPWLRFPEVESINQTATCISGGVNGDTVLFGQLKPGSVVTLTAVDLPDLQWIEWRGGGCGAGRECKITVAQDTDVHTVAVWRTPE